MNCQSIMIAPPVVLPSDATIADAAKAFAACRQNALPVAGADGRYLGTITLHHLVGLVLPRAATIAASANLPDIGFLAENLDDLHSRFAERAGELVVNHMTTDGPTVGPEAEIAEAMLLLYRAHGFIAVVDKQHRLAGIVTSWDALGRVIEGE